MGAAWLQQTARAWTDAPLEASLQATASVLEERLAAAPRCSAVAQQCIPSNLQQVQAPAGHLFYARV